MICSIQKIFRKRAEFRGSKKSGFEIQLSKPNPYIGEERQKEHVLCYRNAQNK